MLHIFVLCQSRYLHAVLCRMCVFFPPWVRKGHVEGSCFNTVRTTVSISSSGLKFIGSNSECRSCIIPDPKIVQLIEQILSKKENPCRHRSLITVPHTYWGGGQWRIIFT
jgi:hypothetical protein